MLNRQRLLKVLHSVKEDQHLVTSPQRNVRRARDEVLALPLFSQLVAHVRKGGVELGFGGKAGAVEATLPIDRSNLALEIRVLGGAEELEEGVLELVRVKRLVGPLAKIVWDELVKVLSSDETVETPDEVETLLVGNRAEGIIGVDTLVADAELCELVILSVLLDGLLCKTFVSRDLLLKEGERKWDGFLGCVINSYQAPSSP